VRDLYAALAPAWVEAGARLHLALVPAEPELAAPWFRLAFGHMQVYALRESGAPDRPLPPGIRIRPGTLADVEATTPLQMEIWRHQQRSPVFTGLAQPSPAELREGWEEALADPDAVYHVLEQDGRIVAHAYLYDAQPGLSRPPRTQHLSALATLPEVRGHGLGVVLSEHVFRTARDAGYAALDADWRMANLQASRFWPRRGFRPTFWRLHRVVGSG
jgi:GNAT superfamily N-acetyltransferase